MKQLLQDLRGGKTKVFDVPIPTPGPGMALVQTGASLVSAGTERMIVEFAEKSLIGKARSRPDLVRQVLDKARREGLLTTVEAAFNRLDQPMPLGYSSAGRIVALGKGMEGFQIGQRVACGGGGFAVHAEYAVVPKNLLAVLPVELAYDEAAFATLGAIAMHGFRLAQPQLSERVGIIGLGLLGLLTARIARAAGCKVFGVDLDANRVGMAVEAGVNAVVRPQAEEAALAFTNGTGLDVVLICADTSSDDPVNLAGEIARDRARVVAIGAVGLNIPRKTYYMKELSFINSRSYGPGRYDPGYEEGGQDYPIGYVRWTEGRNLGSFVELLADAQIEVKSLITHRFPIDEAPAAYELITGKDTEPFVGVVLTYPEPQLEVGKPIEAEPFTSVPDRMAREHPDVVKLGVLGAGNFAAAVMLPAIKKNPKVQLAGIVSASGLSAQHAASKFGFEFADSSEDRIFQDLNLNTVAILTRHHLHAQQVLKTLSAGKHCFVEKPLALDETNLDAIQKAVQAPEAPMLMVGFNRRFAPLAQQLAVFLTGRQEPLTIHYRVNAGYLPLTHWLHDPDQGGGRIIGEGCHFIDFLTYLVGMPPHRVSSFGLPAGGRYRDDNVVMVFTFADGSIGTVEYLANGDKVFPKERVEVFSGGRVAVLDDFRSLELVQNGRRTMQKSRMRQDKGHAAEWTVFANAILNGEQPPIPYRHLFGVTRASFAAVESLRTGEGVQIFMG